MLSRAGQTTAYNGWTYVWNGENRLVLASNAQHVVEYAYDHIGRMAEKTSGGETTRYIWDGYNIIAEVGPASTTYNVWGLDLSGTMQGAGGVGGLLAVSISGQLFAAAYDANGNVTEYVNTSGAVAASRAYGPFGDTTSASETAGTFTHWWSTKPWDEATGFSDYEYRMYSPELGRWPSRDPVEEGGGLLLYGFVGNEPVGNVDNLGNSIWTKWGMPEDADAIDEILQEWPSDEECCCDDKIYTGQDCRVTKGKGWVEHKLAPGTWVENGVQHPITVAVNCQMDITVTHYECKKLLWSYRLKAKDVDGGKKCKWTVSLSGVGTTWNGKVWLTVDRSCCDGPPEDLSTANYWIWSPPEQGVDRDPEQYPYPLPIVK